jgi:hypothetical protein
MPMAGRIRNQRGVQVACGRFKSVCSDVETLEVGVSIGVDMLEIGDAASK